MMKTFVLLAFFIALIYSQQQVCDDVAVSYKEWNAAQDLNSASTTYAAMPGTDITYTYTVQATRPNLLVHVSMFAFTPDDAACTVNVRLMAGGSPIAYVNLGSENTYTQRMTTFTGYVNNATPGSLTFQLQAKGSSAGCKLQVRANSDSLPNFIMVVEAFANNYLTVVQQVNQAAFSSNSQTPVQILGNANNYLNASVNTASLGTSNKLRIFSEFATVGHTATAMFSNFLVQVDGTLVANAPVGDVSYASTPLQKSFSSIATVSNVAQSSGLAVEVQTTPALLNAGGGSIILSSANGEDDRKLVIAAYPSACAANVIDFYTPDVGNFTYSTNGFNPIPTPFQYSVTTRANLSDIFVQGEVGRFSQSDTGTAVSFRLTMNGTVVWATAYPANVATGNRHRPVYIRAIVKNLSPGTYVFQLEQSRTAGTGSIIYASNYDGFNYYRFIANTYPSFLYCNSKSQIDPTVCNGRGTCTATNSCTCNTGYAGNDCQFPVCYGKNSNDVTVCSGKGTCSSPSNCTCNAGYFDFDCSMHTCYGVNKTLPTVCSSNGTCSSPDNCTCNTNYVGNDCSIPVCFGKNASDSTVCSSRGTCASANNCVCAAGYNGNQCQNIICFGVDTSSPSVCSGRGTCTSPDNCVCPPTLWTGATCQFPICYGTNSTDPSVCSNHGTCVSANNCSCPTNQWTGFSCSVPICYGVNSSSPSVCNGHGTCGSPDSCTCTSGWTGLSCPFAICGGVNGSNPLVCSGHGNCGTPDNCTCANGYTGFNCDFPICFGKNSTSPAVCSNSIGTCVSPNNCACPGSYSGPECQFTSCFGTNSTSASVCSNHGACVSPNNCSCAANWTGIACSVPMCFGFNGSDTSNVCTGRGTCTAANTCSCNVGYVGSQCQLALCFGLNSSNPSVCSGHGACNLANNCTCQPNWTGLSCFVPFCFGVNASNPAVCSGHGSCVSVDSCSCTAGYTGSNCSLPICFGKNSTNPTVCSGRAACILPNVCNCPANVYTGPECQFPICYGVNSTSASVCSGHGICGTPDTCTCNNNWVNTTCNVPVCYSLNATNPAVCTGHGTCISNDTCSCTTGYAAGNCSLNLCYGRTSADSQVCSGHGSCVSPNSCSCQTDWNGISCSVPICFAVNATNPAVCSGHGTCTSANTCSCSAGYTGSNCSLPICFGKNSTNPTVCSGRAACTSPNVCACTPLVFTGNECQYPICYGVNSTLPSVCSGHGTCGTPNNCSCIANWGGISCSVPVCYGFNQTDPLVCTSGRGNCASANNCTCNNVGFTGSQCELNICFGRNSSDAQVCSGHGSCTAPQTCVCSANYIGANCSIPVCYGISANSSSVCSNSNGTCTLANNCVCNAGYAGNQCEIPICYGNLANSSAVCSFNNGTCIRRDTCVCNANYVGINCQIPVCYGKLGNTSLACSAPNGTCIRADTCACGGGYSGIECELSGCFGRNSSDPLVCSAHGSCVAPATCNCAANYVGNNCQFPVCYGLNSSNPLVCSGNGTCVSPNTCNCNPGYTPGICQYAICNGRNASDANVCSKRGPCIAPDNCLCLNNYYGNDCQFHNCYAIRMDNASVCSGHGTCNNFNNCTCSAGYTGLDCRFPICYGVNSTNPAVCSGNGTCVAPDTCACSAGFTPGICQYAICNGRNASDANVCSKRGPCIAPDNCLCLNNYYGNDCQSHDCFGVRNDNSSVCSSHGACLVPNNCNCSLGYTGINCQFQICHGINSTNPAVCSNSNGTCIAPDTCSCNANYTGDRCQFAVCFGTPASDNTTCSGHGNCILPNTCVCGPTHTGDRCHIPICYGIPASNTTGTCSGNGACVAPDQCSCQFGWKGSKCDIMHCDDRAGCSGHGLCIAPNNCSCFINQYTDLNCSTPICYGTVATAPSVCSGHGNCVANNTCTCSAGYITSTCSTPVCYGLPATHPNVCSANGTCVTPDNCACNANYSGLLCNFFPCFGVNRTDVSVCSGRGTCFAVDSCACNNGFVGNNCQFPVCYGVPSNNPSVCSSQGSCSSPDNCICNAGYGGNQCENVLNGTTCYGRAVADAQVCSGHGACVAQDTCACNSTYAGSRCQNPVCFGKNVESGGVCSGAGTCVAPNSCSCNAGYSGTQCELISCYGLLSNNANVCSQRGTCLLPNTCLCQSGYVGDCSTAVCYGRNASDPLVCSAHGTCAGPNNCQCANGYIGTTCSTPVCFGNPSTFSGVCSGKGSCTAPDTCVCNSNYIGNQCQTPVCFGIASSSPSVCAGHGTCSDANTCVCSQSAATGYWNGAANCSRCSPDYTGDTCTQLTCDPAVTCNNRGTCQNQVCSCNQDATNGFWAAPYCSTCSPGYFGASCTVACSNTTTCSGHGTCTSSGGCACFSDDVNGYYTGTNCNQCQSGWFGATCSNSVSSTFRFSDSGNSLTGTFAALTLQQTVVDCSIVFNSASLAKLGTNPVCRWPSRAQNPKNFEVVLGANPTVVPNDVLQFNVLITSQTAQYVDSTVLAPNNPPKPTAYATAPRTIGVCDGVTLDGTGSSSPDGRSLTYIWSNVFGLNTSLPATDRVVLTDAMIAPGFTYAFRLVVKNIFNVQSDAFMLNVTKSKNAVASVQISGPSTQSMLNKNFFALESIVTIPDCFYANRDVTFTWRQLSGARVNPVGLSNRTLTFLPFTFPRFGSTQSYVFEVTVRPVANLDVSSSASVTVNVMPSPLVASIKGGNRAIGRDTAFTLDASDSNDPDMTTGNGTLSWSCLRSDGAFCQFANGFTLPSAASIVNVPAGTLAIGVYTFTVNFVKGDRSASTAVTITIVAGSPPVVSFTSVPASKINVQSTVAILGQASLASNPTAQFQYSWVIRNSLGTVVTLPASALLTEANFQNLVIAPNSLTAGESYTFTLTATVGQESGSATTNPITINDPPRPGTFSITPSSGFAGLTSFTLLSSQWSDIDTPLTYAYGTIQNGLFVPLTTTPSASNQFPAVLPLGNAASGYSLTVQVRVYDSLGAFTSLNAQVTVQPVPDANKTALCTTPTVSSSLNDALAQNDNEGVIRAVRSTLLALNSITCDTGNLANRQAIRQQLADALISSAKAYIASGRPVTSEFVSQFTTISSEVTAKRDEVNTVTIQNLSSFNSYLASLTAVPANTTTGQTSIRVDESMLIAFLKALCALAESPLVSKEVSSYLINSISTLVRGLTAGKIAGESQTVISDTCLSLYSKKLYSTSADRTLALTSSRGSTNINLPTSFFTEIGSKLRSVKQTTTASIVSLNGIVYNTNPYSWSGDASGVSTSILSFTVRNGNNDEIAVNNLANPITLQLPGSFNLNSTTTNASLIDTCGKSMSLATCRYWDTTSESWSSVGCTATALTANSITCSCNHLTDFSGFQVFYNASATTPIITPSDLIEVIKTSNYTTLAFMLAFVGIYAALMIVMFAFDKLLPPVKSASKAKSVIDHLIYEHVWISLIYRPTNPNSFTRPQRLTVVYLIVMLICVANVTIFYQAVPTVGRVVAAVFISTLFSIPGPLLVRVLFGCISSGYHASTESNEKPIKAMQANSIVEMKHFEFEEVEHYASSKSATIYGVSLTNVMLRAQEQRNNIPYIIDKMITHIETNAVTNTGLNPAKDEDVKEIRAKVDAGADVDFGKYPIDSVVGALKLYFETLPEPLFIFNFSDLKNEMSNEEKVAIIKATLEKTPEESISVLNRVFAMLKQLVDSNKVQASAIAAVFGVSFLGKSHGDDTTHYAVLAVQEMILQYDQVFEKANKNAKTAKRKSLAPSQVLAPVTEKEVTLKETKKAKPAVAYPVNVIADSAHASLGNGIIPVAFIVSAVFLVCYFGLVIASVIVMELVLPKSWANYLTTLIICLSVFCLPLVFTIAYFSEKRKLYFTEGKWEVSKISIVLLLILAATSIIAFIATFAISSGAAFWTTYLGIGHTIIIAGSIALFTALCIISIVLHIAKPIDLGFAPWWCIIFVYPLVWASIIICSVILVVYGIIYSANRASSWVIASLIAIAFNILIVQPIGMLVTGVIYPLFARALGVLFFSSQVNLQQTIAASMPKLPTTTQPTVQATTNAAFDNIGEDI